MDRGNVIEYVRNLNNCCNNFSDTNATISCLSILHDRLNFEKNTDQITYLVDVILHEESGIWTFLKELKGHHSSRDLLSKVYDFIELICKQKHFLTEKQTRLFFDYCKNIIKSHTLSSDIKDLAYKTFSLIIKHGDFQFFVHNAGNLLSCLKELYFNLQSNKSTEKRQIYELIGAIAENHPEVVKEDRSFVEKIFRKISNELSIILEKKDGSGISEVEGMLCCINGLLLHLPECSENYNKKLYRSLVDVTKRNSTKHVASRAVFDIIKNFFDVFADSIKKDYDYWYTLLNNVLSSSNKENSQAAKKALNEFYAHISKLLLEKTDTNKTILKFFMVALRNDVIKGDKNKRELALKNFTCFVEPCKQLEETNSLNEIFMLTFSLLNNFCSSISELNQESIIHLSIILQSTSGFLRYLSREKCNDEYFQVLADALVLTVSAYTKVPENMKFLVITPLLETIINVANINEAHLDKFLESIIYPGIVMSCSSMTEGNVDYLKEAVGDGDSACSELLTFRDYLPIWKNMLDIANSESIKNPGDRNHIYNINLEGKIYDCVIDCMLRIIEKLDLTMKSPDQRDNQECPILVEYDKIPSSEADFNIFVNLVELFSNLFEKRNDNFHKWIPILISKMIELAAQNDLKFGFYKILSVTFKQIKKNSRVNFDSGEVKAFVLDEMNYLNELQKTDSKACLQMVMSLPIDIVNEIVPDVVPALQLSLERGAEDLGFASEALDCLNRWYLEIPKENFKVILPEIIAYLKPFIQSKRFAGETILATKHEKKLIQQIIANPTSKINRKYRRAYMQSMDSELDKLQQQVVKFLGKIDTDIWVPIFTPDTFVDREVDDVLKFQFPFKDMKIDVFLDKFLPRLIDLACNSSDFNSRRDACEAFQSCVIVFLGNSRHLLDAPKIPVLFKKITTVAFKLGADENTTIQQIFSLLSRQMAHYYSSKIEKRSSITNAFLEILFDAVAAKGDATYRKFIAELFNEFVTWTLKQGTDDSNLAGGNIKAIVKHICLFCLQPCPYKKLGAAVAFNSIYDELDKNEKIRRMFFLELFLHFVRSLSTSASSDCCVIEIQNAVDKLTKTLHRYFHVFNARDELRRIPTWFNGASLFDVQLWLFEYCFSSNEQCRIKCMEILVKLLDGNEGRPELKAFIADKALRRFRNNASDLRKLDDVDYEHFIDEVYSRLNTVSANLHCFLWIVENKSQEMSIFTDDKYKLMTSVKYFLERLVDTDLKTLILSKFPSHRGTQIVTGQEKRFAVLREQTIRRIFQIVALSEIFSCLFFGDQLYMKNFQRIFIKCLFDPCQVFVYKRSKLDLRSELETILVNLRDYPMKGVLFKEIQDHSYWDTFSSILDDPSRARTTHRSNSRILSVLQNSNVLWDIFEELDLERIVRKIFHQIVREDQGSKKAVVLDITVVSYFENYLIFALKAQYKRDFYKLADYLFCADVLTSASGKITFTHGLHFFNTFRTPILEYLLDHEAEFMKKCAWNLSPDVLKMLLVYLEFASVKKERDCSAIIEYWPTLKSSESVEVSDLIKILDFGFRRIDTDKVEILSSVYDWLLDYLRRADTRAEVKYQILDLLPAFIGFEFSSRYDNKFKEILEEVWKQEIDAKVTAEALVVYKKLLNVLSTTGNGILFEVVIKIAISKGSSFQENVFGALEKLVERSPDEQLKAIDVPWNMFKNTDLSTELRIGSMELFVVPMLHLTSKPNLEEFYVQNMEFILSNLLLKIERNRGQESASLVSMIGAVLAINTYYDEIPIKDNPRIKSIVLGSETGTLNSKFAKIARSILQRNPAVQDENKDLLLKLRSHAFNTLIGVIKEANIGTYTDAEKWCKFIFDNKDNCLWPNIVKLEPAIKLTMTVEEIRTRRKEVIRKRRQMKESTCSLSIATQYATCSSLAPEVSKYDVNHFTIRSNKTDVVVEDVELFSEDREQDVLNNHESMNTLCDFVRSIENKGILIQEDDRNEPVFPGWMEKIREALISFIDPKNIKPDGQLVYQNCVLFILKFITNCETVFRHFAKYWFTTLMTCLERLNQMNYVVTDVILMLLQWHDKVVPEDRASASNIFKMFTLKVCKHSTSTRNYLLEMMKAMIQVWHAHFDVPYHEIVDLLHSDDKVMCTVGLNLCEYFLLFNVFPYNETTKDRVMNNLLKKFNDQKERSYTKQVATILGLVLKTASKDENGTLNERYKTLKKQIVANMNELNNSLRVKTVDNFCLMEHLITQYPPILEEFTSHFLAKFDRLQGSYKRNCLKILTNHVKYLPKDAFNTLFNCNFESMLKTNDHDLSEQALMLITSFMSEPRMRIRIEDLHKIIEDVRRLSAHESSQCRKAAYDVADCIYEMYKNQSYEDARILVTTCKDILLAGLLDSDAELQNKVYESWKTRSNLEDSISARFLNIVKTMYSPQHEAHFISYAVDFILEACASSLDYNSLLFPSPLKACAYEDYQIISSRRKKQSSLAPLFLNSIPYKIATLGRTTGTMSLQIYQTQGSVSPSLTFSSSTPGASLSAKYSPGSFHPLKYISPASAADAESKPLDNISRALNRLKKRIIENPQEVSYAHAVRNARINEERRQVLANQADRRDKKVELKRQYRKGEWPDIQIKNSDLITPLKALAKRDPLIAKQLFTNLFLNMVDQMENPEEYLDSVNAAFDEILQSTQQYGSICLESILEIAYLLPKRLQLNVKSMAIASNMNNLLCLKALLLENSLIYGVAERDHGPSASKRPRVEYSNDNDSLWMQVAEVYKSLDRYDVVNGIFKEKIQNNCCQLLKKALEYETIGNWESAFNTYEEEINKLNEFNYASQDHKFILDAYYQCAAYLGKWSEMNGKIEEKFPKMDKILQDNWHRECTLPWYFLSEAYKTVDSKFENGKFKTEMLKMVENDDPLLLDLLAEPSSMLLFMYGDEPKSRNLIKRSLDLILKEFNFSDSSLETFLKLQTLSEIGNMLSVFQTNHHDTEKNIKEMLAIWQRCEANKDHSIWWDRRMAYRHRFVELYENTLNDSMNETSIDLCKSLNDYRFYSGLQFCEKALDQQNYILASKYTIKANIGNATINRKNRIPDEWQFKTLHNLCRMYTYRADRSDSVDCANRAAEKIRQIRELNWKCDYETSMATCDLLKVIKKKSTVWSTDVISSLLETFSERSEQITEPIHELNHLIAENYVTAHTKAEKQGFPYTQISSAYLALAKHCREVLNESKKEDELQIDLQIGVSILRAMKYDSKEAYQLFPVLLHLSSCENAYFINTFVEECRNVEEWKFLSWINQLLVYIYTNKSALVGDLVLRMVEKYPKAFHFPFLLSQDANDCKTGPLIQKIHDSLKPLDDVSTFVKALTFVSDPNHKIKNYIKRLDQSLNEDDADTICQKFYEFQNDVESYGGNFWPSLKSLFDRDQLRSRRVEDKNVVKSKLKKYEELIKTRVGEMKESKLHLNWYSKILSDFIKNTKATIELPGQYDGFTVPRPEHHVKLFGFKSDVEALHSLKKPRKITVYGDDAKEYSFLVKSNEDTRQDQRVQQLFTIINNALTSKSNVFSKHLTLNTYGVYPLKRDLGMMEWVEDSIILKTFPYFNLPEEENNDKMKWFRDIMSNYENKKITMYAPLASSREDKCHKLAKSCATNKTNIVSRFLDTSKEIPADIYKKALLLLTTTPHSFWRLRNQFMANYSAMSIASWILGIGDRHLENILVSLKKGTCVGIDFGRVFGTATDFQLVPELIPFRMTPHIVSIMEPFQLTGLIRETMIYVLQTLRENDYVLLATTPIFISDPSIDWLAQARESLRHVDQDDESRQNKQNNQDLRSYYENKINNVKLKLEGCHPLNVTINELHHNPHLGQYCSSYVALVRSSKGTVIGLHQNKLTTEEQVDCLLGIATDPSILATSWFGLETWI